MDNSVKTKKSRYSKAIAKSRDFRAPKNDHILGVTLIIAGTVILLAALGWIAVSLLLNVSANEVNVDGNAEIKVMPDIAAVYFRIETNGSNAGDASSKNSEIEETVIAALLQQGFARDKITTQSYENYEDFEWTDNGRKSTGWKAIHRMKIEMTSDKISLAGNAIDAAVNNGAIVEGINFELTKAKENEYKKQAITQATLDARAKAEGIADGLGVKVAKVVSVSTSDWGYRPWAVYDKMVASSAMVEEAKAAVTTIQPGEQTVSATVSVTYKLNT